MKILTKTILILSVVSLLTDVSSEMLYPVMPLFLTSIGFSVIWIGIIEGIAEATAGFSKGYFGKLSDASGKRVPFVRVGYFLSSIAKPALILIAHPLWVVFVRTMDRLGKGVRTSARDAILSDESTRENKGKVFGLHRAADTFGAAVGPVIALVFLYFYPGNYVLLFLLAFIPAVIGVLFTFLIKDKREQVKQKAERINFISFLKYWKSANREYKKLIPGLIAFTVFNSSDMFLLLFAKYRGMPDDMVIVCYILYNLIYAIFSTPMGYLGDRIGLKNSFLIGLLFFVITYLTIIFASEQIHFFIIFFLYGVFGAGTEGISKAWISNIAEQSDTATAIGFYNSFQSIGALLASIGAGLAWSLIAPTAPFIFSGLGVLAVIFYIQFSIRNNKILSA